LRSWGAAGGSARVGTRLTATALATGLATVLGTGLAGLLAVPAAGAVQGAAPAAGPATGTTSVASGGTRALQVRRTNAVGDATVDLAVLPTAAARLKVAQGGQDLPADSKPMVSRTHPLGIVVQVRPEQLAGAQGLIADALAMLPPRVGVRLAPLAADDTGATSASAADSEDPATALAGLDRLVAEPSASVVSRSTAALTGAGAARAVLVVTTCPGGQVPDVGSAGTTAWVLGWGDECAHGAPAASAARVVERAPDMEEALGSLPALVRQIVAARSVQVVARGSQPLVVTASGVRGTVALADRGAAALSTSGRTGRELPGGTTLAALVALAATGLLAALAVLRHRRAAAAALPVSSPDDDRWSGLVPEWTRVHGRHEASGPAARRPRAVPGPRPPGRHVAGGPAGADPGGHRPDLVIDLRHPAEARREAPEGSA
jgi:hypothetical protein